MRRWLKQLFPLVMLAVLVQILAPIGPIAAVGAALDPFNNAPICSAHVDAEDNSSGNGTLPHATCCPLCAVGQAFALPPVDLAVSILPLRSWRAFNWIAPDHVHLAAEALGHAQARASPLFS